MAQCPSVHSGTRCKKLRGHTGWHYGGMFSHWLSTKERKDALADGRCEARTRNGKQVLHCELPDDHPVAHRYNGMIWMDPVVMP